MRPTAHQNSRVLEKFQEKLDFRMTFSVGPTFVTKPSMLLENVCITTVCRAYMSTREKGSKQTGTINDKTVIGPALDRHRIEIKIDNIARVWVFPDLSTSAVPCSRANYVAVENYPQPSLQARCDSLRQQELPNTYLVKAVPNTPGMTHISTESRQ